MPILQVIYFTYEDAMLTVHVNGHTCALSFLMTAEYFIVGIVFICTLVNFFCFDKYLGCFQFFHNFQ